MAAREMGFIFVRVLLLMTVNNTGIIVNSSKIKLDGRKQSCNSYLLDPVDFSIQTPGTASSFSTSKKIHSSKISDFTLIYTGQ